MSWDIIQLSINISAALRSVFFDTGTARVSLEYLSVTAMKNWFPFEVFDSGPNMSTAVNLRGACKGVPWSVADVHTVLAFCGLLCSCRILHKRHWHCGAKNSLDVVSRSSDFPQDHWIVSVSARIVDFSLEVSKAITSEVLHWFTRCWWEKQIGPRHISSLACLQRRQSFFKSLPSNACQ